MATSVFSHIQPRSQSQVHPARRTCAVRRDYARWHACAMNASYILHIRWLLVCVRRRSVIRGIWCVARICVLWLWVCYYTAVCSFTYKTELWTTIVRSFPMLNTEHFEHDSCAARFHSQKQQTLGCFANETT